MLERLISEMWEKKKNIASLENAPWLDARDEGDARVSCGAWPFSASLICIAASYSCIEASLEKMSARMFSLLFVIFLVFCQGSSKTGDKDNPFRVKKLNMIWQKAQNKMSERKLSDFRRLLENQDRAEIRWKELKASGGDEDGEMEATLRRKFSRVLEQFGLEEHLNSVSEDENKIKDNRAGHGSYSDKRLDELWESVQNQGLCLLYVT